MARIYNKFAGEVHTVEKGWIPYYPDYFKAHYTDLTVTQWSPRYIDDDGTEGQEDFSLERWRECKFKQFDPELRTFRAGRGWKRVADSIIDCGQWYGRQRKDVIKYLKERYAHKLAKGYEITW